MRAVTWILSCLSLVALSECSQIASTVKCKFESLSNVRIKVNRDILQMQAEGGLYNWKLGFAERATVISKELYVDIITTCYDTYCRSLWKEIPRFGGYYLRMHSNGYIYETSSTSEDSYFDYAYNPVFQQCGWKNRVYGSFLSRSGITKPGGYFVIGGSDPNAPVLDPIFF